MAKGKWSGPRDAAARREASAGPAAEARAGAARPAGGAGPGNYGGGGDGGDASVRIPAWLPPALYALLTLWLFRAFVFSRDMLYGSDTLALGYMARKFYADALASGAFPAWNPLILGGTPFLESLAGGDALYPTSLLLLLMEPYRALGWKLVVHVFLAGLFMFGWVRTLGCSRAAALLAGLAYAFAPFLVSFVQPGHDGKLFVTALAPLLFWASERTLVRPGALSYVGVALVVALVLLTTHFQKAYFLFGGVGAYYLFRVGQVWWGAQRDDPGEGPGEATIRRPRAAAVRLGLFLAAAVAGASAAAVQLLPAVDYVTQHSRRTATTVGADLEDNVAYSSSWSLHPEEVMSYLVPEFAGNNAGAAGRAQGTYWGRNGWKDNHETTGLVVLLLAGLAFLGAPRRGLRFFLLGLGTVALLFGLGQTTPVWRIFYELLPGISLFRAPSQAAFLFGFAAITLAAFGVDRALEMAGGAGERRVGSGGPAGRGRPAARGGRKGEGARSGAGQEATRGRRSAKERAGREEEARRGERYLWIAAGVMALLMLLAASGALLSFWTSVVYAQMEPAQAFALERARPFIVRGFFVAALLAAATAATVWAGRRRWLQPTGVAALLGLLLAADALRIDAAFIETFPYQAWATPDPNDRFLLDRQREEEPFRVASLARTGQEVRPAMFGIELATGHHPNDLGRYRELIGMRGSDLPEHLLFFVHGPNVLSLLNVRYFVWPAEFGDLSELMAELEVELPGLTPVSQTQLGGRPHETVYALPGLARARLVAEAEVAAGVAAVERILEADFDPERVAMLADPPPVALPGGEVNGEVTWLEREANRMRLRVTSDRPALLVIADNWFPSWRARVNGRDAPVLRAYHTLRAVPVEPGEQTVELYYHSPLVRLGLGISLATLALLLAVGVVAMVRSRRRGAARAEG